MNGDTNYDEFGNYIGPDLDSDLSEDDYDDYNPNDSAQNSGVGAANQAAMELQNDDIDSEMMEMAISNPEAAAEARATYLATQNGSRHINSNAIVLAEDKQYYPRRFRCLWCGCRNFGGRGRRSTINKTNNSTY